MLGKLLLIGLPAILSLGQGRSKVIIDQDCSGPGSTNTNSILAMLQSDQVEIIGITVSSGDGWLAESTLHCLRLLELVGRTDVPVVVGAAMPWSGSAEGVRRWEALHGTLSWKGGFSLNYTALEVFPAHFPEGMPTTAPLAHLSAAQFIVDAVRQAPGEITLLALGPLTNIATALVLEPTLPGLAKELVLGGGAIDCGGFVDGVEEDGSRCDLPDRPKWEFNLWFDAAAAVYALHQRPAVIPPWSKLTMIPVDLSSRSMWVQSMRDAIQENSTTRASKYLGSYVLGTVQETYAMFDEVVVLGWLHPEIFHGWDQRFVSVDDSAGVSRGDTLTWASSGRDAGRQPGLGEQLARVPLVLDLPLFRSYYLDLIFRRA